MSVFDPPPAAESIVLEMPNGELITADRISALGQVVARRPGEDRWHIWDVVGTQYYPYPSDFLEEVRTEGLSRRSPSRLRFDLLGKGSCIYLLHDRGHILNAAEYYQAIPEFQCPKKRIHPPDEPCAGLWWCDIDKNDSEPLEKDVRMYGLPMRKRRIAQRTYRCIARPDNIHPRYARGVIASFPIWRLAVVRSSDDRHVSSYRSASGSGLQVEYVNE